VARIETGEIAPSLEVMQRILDAAGLSLVVVDRDGRRARVGVI
jgi:predicted transcriptional regulator